MSRRTRLAVLLVLALVVAPASTAPVGASAAPAESTQDGTILRTFTVSLTPETPGQVEVVMAFDLPPDVSRVTTQLPVGATVRETTGFEQTAEGYRSTSDSPSIRYALPVNRSTDRGYEYVDTGSWAIAPTPGAGFSYQYRGSAPSIDTDYEIDGAGVAGRSMLYLGPNTVHERTTSETRFRLVVPESADPLANTETILDTLAAGVDGIEVGSAAGDHVVIAAPTSVDWGPSGIARGSSDFWVRADLPVATANNVWLHEYVHTRQPTETTAAMRWSIEGGADYYAALETLRQERIEFAEFQHFLGRAARYDEAVLSKPDTWSSPFVPYVKGRLVAGEIDRQIRVASDGSATLATALNGIDGEISLPLFYDAVESAGNATVRANAERLVETASTPRPWSQEQHRAAFQQEIATATQTATATKTPTAISTETPTAISTATAIETPEQTAVSTATPTGATASATEFRTTQSSGQPGFGGVVTVAAVVAAGLLARRQK
ncbi:MAG: PGF-CTERM sorting domain-containing protein [Halobacteriales archaeon]|nr:PGF-CTERM sorting domain-containing protein [Halobacteriales archaeon]